MRSDAVTQVKLLRISMCCCMAILMVAGCKRPSPNSNSMENDIASLFSEFAGAEWGNATLRDILAKNGQGKKIEGNNLLGYRASIGGKRFTKIYAFNREKNTVSHVTFTNTGLLADIYGRSAPISQEEIERFKSYALEQIESQGGNVRNPMIDNYIVKAEHYTLIMIFGKGGAMLTFFISG